MNEQLNMETIYRQERQRWMLEILLFLTTLVNRAGPFSSVIGAVGLETLSFTAKAEGFGNLPATSQAALIMAALSAFIIPIGALVAGDGLAILALERRSPLETDRTDGQAERHYEAGCMGTFERQSWP